MLSDDGISQVLQAHESLDMGCKALIDAANDAGGKDNISVVLVRVVGGTTASARSWWPFRR
jgi:protein phosphatase